ncbi:unnamed protein product [Choristocarpus tenellus]
MCDMCPKLSYTQRVWGFGFCLLLGYVLSFLSTFTLIGGDLRSFAVIYVLGSIIAIAATG